MFKMGKINIKEKVGEGWIHSAVIIEVMGKPEEYVQQVIEKYVEAIELNENLIIIEKKFEKPQQNEGLFVAFVEIELLLKNTKELLNFCFDYMPSSVEIIAPEKIIYETNDLMDLINDLQLRLHNIDMALKTEKQKNSLVHQSFDKALFNLLRLGLGDSKKTITELSSITNLSDKAIEQLVNRFSGMGLLIFDGSRISMNKKILSEMNEEESKSKKGKKSAKKSKKEIAKTKKKKK